MKYSMSIMVAIIVFSAATCQTQQKTTFQATSASDWSAHIPDKVVKVDKDESIWKQELSEMEYYVLREKGTERSFTGDLLKNDKEGLYVCRGCGLPLFASDTKFKSGTGWPSFYQPVKKEFLVEETDYVLGYGRTELTCAQCGGHQGHVFPDGPAPTGLRYCINAVSLDFVAINEEQEEE